VNMVGRCQAFATLNSLRGRGRRHNAEIRTPARRRPGWRAREVRVAAAAAGTTHRVSTLLIKDKPHRVAGSVSEAVRRAWAKAPEIESEVEADTLPQDGGCRSGGADAILLDNMPPELLVEAVRLVPAGRARTEARAASLETVAR